MSLSPDSSLVRRTIDLNYANKQRSESLKWIFINGALLLIFTFDLWYKCPGYTSALHYCEGAAAAAAAASALRHALRLVPPALWGRGWGRRGRAPAALSPRQQRLLGLADADLDCTFRVTPPSPPAACDSEAEEEPPASLSPARSWRAGGVGGGASPPRAPAPTPPSPPPERAPRDEFIADREELHRYLSAQEAAESASESERTQFGAGVLGGARVHQLSAGGVAPPPAPGQPAAWRRLHVEPAHLAHFELNLRRWLHESILARVVRELDACEAELGGAEGASARARAVLPFVGAGRAAAARVRELARGGCLAAYRWDADAELVLQLFCAYMDAVTGGAFSAAHVCAPAAAACARSPALQLVARRPPHCAVWVRGRAADVSRGRHNLLHSLLLFLAAAAAERPPALARHSLGPHGLNMLWILGR